MRADEDNIAERKKGSWIKRMNAMEHSEAVKMAASDTCSMSCHRTCATPLKNTSLIAMNAR